MGRAPAVVGADLFGNHAGSDNVWYVYYAVSKVDGFALNFGGRDRSLCGFGTRTVAHRFPGFKSQLPSFDAGAAHSQQTDCHAHVSHQLVLGWSDLHQAAVALRRELNHGHSLTNRTREQKPLSVAHKTVVGGVR